MDQIIKFIRASLAYTLISYIVVTGGVWASQLRLDWIFSMRTRNPGVSGIRRLRTAVEKFKLAQQLISVTALPLQGRSGAWTR